MIISGQLVVIGFVYLIGYHYYDRARPHLGGRALRWLKSLLVTAGVSLSTVALAISLHNMVYALFGLEDAFFFILGLLVAPAVCALSLLGSFFLSSRECLPVSEVADRHENADKRVPRPAGLTQEKLADSVGVRRETIIFLEKGKYNPSLKLAYNIARTLKARIEDIFIFDED